MYRVHLLLVALVIISCQSEQTRRDRYFLDGNKFLEKDDFESAILYYNKALEEDPDFDLAYNNRGVAYMENGHPYEAIMDYNQAILINPGYWECIHNRAQANDLVGRYRKSLDDYQLLSRQFPDSALGYFGQGLILTKLTEYSKAARSFERVLELDPEDHEALINLAILDYYQGDYEKGIARIDSALKISDDARAYNTLNQIHIELGNYPVALNAINKALDRSPEEPYFLNNRGLTYLLMDSLDLGITDINRSIVNDPENMWAFRNKGIYFLKTQDVAQAIRYLEEAESSGIFVGDIYFYLGEAYRLSNQLEIACTQWLKGIARNEQKSKERHARFCP